MLSEHIPQPPLAQPQIGGQALGDGDQAEAALSAPLELHRDVQGFAGQVGEGVEGVHHLGGEDGEDVIPEIALALLALLHVQLREGEGADIAGPQPGLQLLKELVPLLVEGAHRPEDGGELLLRGEAALGVDMGLLHQGHVVDGAHPDHEELIQVAGEDGGELEALEEGDGLIPGLLHDPLVEAQPGELPLLGVAVIPCLLV